MKFIKLSNTLITESHEQHLTPEEMAVYVALLMETNYRNQICTTVSTLDANLTIKFSNQTTRNVKKIIEIIQSLGEKEVIKIEFADNKKDIYSFNKNDVFFVWTDEVKSEFTPLLINDLERFNNVYHLYAFISTNRWINAGSFICSYDRWAKLMSCSLSHAKKTIKEMVNNHQLYKNVGDYNNSGKQDVNKYKTTPFDADEKTISTNKFESKKPTESKKVDNQESKKEITAYEFETEILIYDKNQIATSYNNFNSKNSTLTNEDVVLYLETIFISEHGEEHYNVKLTDFDEKFNAVANARIGRIKTSEKGKKFIEQLIEKATYEFESLFIGAYDDYRILPDSKFLESFRLTTDKYKTDENLNVYELTRNNIISQQFDEIDYLEEMFGAD